MRLQPPLTHGCSLRHTRLQAAQLSGFVLEQMKSAKHAMRNQFDLRLQP
jgi:hypothetical protein